MKRIQKTLNILSWPVYLCIIAYLLIAAPLLAGYRPVVVLSGSMEPTYHVASVIYYKQAPFEQISEGDAITYQAGEDSLVTHRVAEKLEVTRQFITKGDANPTQDPNPVSYENVVGKALPFSIPYAGYFVDFGKKPAVIGVMALILIGGMAADWLVKSESGETPDKEAEKKNAGPDRKEDIPGKKA